MQSPRKDPACVRPTTRPPGRGARAAPVLVALAAIAGACDSATGPAGTETALFVLSGDDQVGPVNAVLADSLVVRVATGAGQPAGGIEVEWQVTAGGGRVDPVRSTTDPTGRARTAWTLGPEPGENRVVARLVGTGAVTAAFVATGVQPDPTGGPVLERITPAVLTPGDTAVIAGRNFAPDPGGNRVEVDGVPARVVSASETELTVVLRQRGDFACRPAGDVPVVVSVGGATASRPHGLAIALRHDLEPGEAALLLGAEDVACHELPVTGGRFLISVFNTVPSVAARTGFELRGGDGDEALAVAASPSTAGVTRAAPSAGAAGDALMVRPDRAHAVHTRLLETNRRLLQTLTATRPAPSTAAARSAAAVATLPAAGDTVAFRVPDVDGQLCTDYTEVLARTVHVGGRSVVFEDVRAPLAGTMDDALRSLGREFDDGMYGILSTHFGDPLAANERTNGLGRVFMLFTPAVNDAGRGLAGFVFSGDFFDRERCASSNLAEVFYARVPTSAEPGFNGDTRAQWRRVMRSTVIHEVKHITSFAERIARGAAVFEETWLEEGTARLAEELWGRGVYGYDWKENTRYRASIYCEVRPARAECEGGPLAVLNHFYALYQYHRGVDGLSPLGPIDAGDATFYGSGWSLVRWALDHYAESEAAFLRALTQDGTRSGVANLQARTGRSFAAMLAEWSLALVAERPGSAPPANARLRFPSWDVAEIYAGLNDDFRNVFPTPAPLAARPVGFGSFAVEVPAVRGGSAAFFELAGTQTTPQLLALRSPAGGPPSPALRIAILRVE